MRNVFCSLSLSVPSQESNKYSNVRLFVSQLIATSFYLAPEVVGREGYGSGVDIWAAGVVLYIMLCGRFPFWGKSDIEYLASLRRGPDMTGDEWSRVSAEGKTFVKALLELDPRRRPSAAQALNLPWMLARPTSPVFSLNRLESVAGIALVREQTQKERQKNAVTQKAKDVGIEEAHSPITPSGSDFRGFDSD
jgi:serine/threonine protein kinase